MKLTPSLTGVLEVKPALITYAAILTLTLCLGCKDPGNSPRASDSAPDQVGGEEGSKPEVPYGQYQLDQLAAGFNQVLASVQLDEQQSLELESFHKDSIQNLRNWYSENGPTIVAIRKKAFSAARSKNLAKLQKMKRGGDQATVEKLANEERKLLQNYREALEEKVPSDQKLNWQSDVITDKLLEFLAPLELTDMQKSEVKDLAPNALKRLGGKQLKNWRGYGTSELEKLFEKQVLPKQQIQSFEDLKKKNRIRMLKWSETF